MTSAWGRGSTSTPLGPGGSLYQMCDYVTRGCPAHRDPLPGLDEARHQQPLRGEPGTHRLHREPPLVNGPAVTPPSRCPGARGPRRLPRQQAPCCGGGISCQLLRHHDSPPLPTLVDVGLDDPSWRSGSASTPWPKWPPPGRGPDAQPPCRLRPQLLLRGELHRGAPALSRQPPGRTGLQG